MWHSDNSFFRRGGGAEKGWPVESRVRSVTGEAGKEHAALQTTVRLCFAGIFYPYWHYSKCQYRDARGLKGPVRRIFFGKQGVQRGLSAKNSLVFRAVSHKSDLICVQHDCMHGLTAVYPTARFPSPPAAHDGPAPPAKGSEAPEEGFRYPFEDGRGWHELTEGGYRATRHQQPAPPAPCQQDAGLDQPDPGPSHR